MKTYNMKSMMLILLPILIIPIIGVAHAQTASEIDIATGAGSSSQAICVAANNCFSPNPLTIAPGTTVTWKNTDTTTHVICSGKVTDDQCGSVFEDDALKNGQTFQFTFANAGTFDYYCSVHPWMTGQVIVGASGTVTTPQPTQPTVSLTTDRQSYNQGDTIIMSGQVNNSIQHTAVTLRIFNSHGDLISTAQLLPSSDGSFTKTILATGPLWADAGTYTITYQYGSLGIPSNQTFYYNGGDGQSTVTKAINSTYSLQVGGQTYNIPYIIKGGTVSSMNVLAQQYTFEITTSTNSDGSLTVMLPRSLIDAKSVNGDINFIITVNGISITQFSETTNPTIRILSIPFHNGDTKIDIIGTQIADSSTSNPTNTPTGIATVTTDKASYNDGDKITISGTVSNYIANALVNVRIIDPIGNLVKVDQVDLGSDRTFSTSITATGALWQEAGAYTIRVQYGSPDTTTTTFQFSGSSGNGQGGNTIKVDGTDLSVKYSITNGQVLDIATNTQSKSLIVSTQTTGDGVLTITLPRTLISATLPTGQDDKYYVLVNGQEADFQETSTTTTDRTLSIPFTDGTKKIEIIGTDLVGNRISSTPSNPYLGCPDCNNNQQIQLTSGGTLKVGLSTDSINPNTTGQTQLKINFMNKQDSTIQPHIDYKVSIIQGSNQIFGIPLTHTALGSVTIPIQFQNSGTYQVIVEVDGILFQPIPPESSTFYLQVGTQMENGSMSHPNNPYLGCPDCNNTNNIHEIPSSARIPSTPVITPTQQDIENINQAKNNQTIAAEVNVGSSQSETRSIDNSVSVQTTSTTPDSLGVKVSAPDQTGPKVIVFNLNATTINVSNLKDLGVMYDGKLISPAPNMDTILHAKSTDNPSFAIVVTQSGVQVLVLVPHFSTHTITLTNMSKVIPAVPEFGPIVGIITIMSLIGSIIISRRFFTSTKVQ